MSEEAQGAKAMTTEPINVEEGLALLARFGRAKKQHEPVELILSVHRAGEELRDWLEKHAPALLASQQQLAEAVEVLQGIADEGIFSQQRFAEDTDTDYFLRCFKAVKDRARDFLTKHRREG